MTKNYSKYDSSNDYIVIPDGGGDEQTISWAACCFWALNGLCGECTNTDDMSSGGRGGGGRGGNWSKNGSRRGRREGAVRQSVEDRAVSEENRQARRQEQKLDDRERRNDTLAEERNRRAEVHNEKMESYRRTHDVFRDMIARYSRGEPMPANWVCCLLEHPALASLKLPDYITFKSDPIDVARQCALPYVREGMKTTLSGSPQVIEAFEYFRKEVIRDQLKIANASQEELSSTQYVEDSLISTALMNSLKKVVSMNCHQHCDLQQCVAVPTELIKRKNHFLPSFNVFETELDEQPLLVVNFNKVSFGLLTLPVTILLYVFLVYNDYFNFDPLVEIVSLELVASLCLTIGLWFTRVVVSKSVANLTFDERKLLKLVDTDVSELVNSRQSNMKDCKEEFKKPSFVTVETQAYGALAGLYFTLFRRTNHQYCLPSWVEFIDTRPLLPFALSMLIMLFYSTLQLSFNLMLALNSGALTLVALAVRWRPRYYHRSIVCRELFYDLISPKVIRFFGNFDDFRVMATKAINESSNILISRLSSSLNSNFEMVQNSTIRLASFVASIERERQVEHQDNVVNLNLLSPQGHMTLWATLAMKLKTVLHPLVLLLQVFEYPLMVVSLVLFMVSLIESLQILFLIVLFKSLLACTFVIMLILILIFDIISVSLLARFQDLLVMFLTRILNQCNSCLTIQPVSSSVCSQNRSFQWIAFSGWITPIILRLRNWLLQIYLCERHLDASGYTRLHNSRSGSSVLYSSEDLQYVEVGTGLLESEDEASSTAELLPVRVNVDPTLLQRESVYAESTVDILDL